MALHTNTRRSHKKQIVAIVVVALLLVGGYGLYANAYNTWPLMPNNNTTNNSQDTASGKVSKGNSDKNTDESDLIKKGGNKNQGKHSTDGTGVSDNQGKGVSPQSGGVSSDSKQITLYTPKSGQTLTSGTSIKGAASVSKIQYRISDDIHGQIGQGSLDVKDGYFSGTISVNGTDAKSGTFEVYSFNSQGQEVNHIGIKVKY